MNNPITPYNKTVKSAKITAIASAILAAVIAIAYYLGLRFDFEYDIGHFERGSALFYILAGAIIVAVLIPTALFVFSKNKASITSTPSTNGAPVFFVGFASVMAIIACASEIIELRAEYAPGTLAIISAVGLIAVALGLFTIASDKFNTKPLAQIALPLASLGIAVRILDAYFDQTLVLNSPVRHITMLAELSVMFLFLSESRLSFGIESTDLGNTARKATVPFYLFTNNVCASLTIGFSAGALMHELIPLHLVDATAETAAHPSLLRLALYLALGALALTRALTVNKITGEFTPSPLEDAKTNDDAETVETDETDKNLTEKE